MEPLVFKKAVEKIADEWSMSDKDFRREVLRMLGKIEGEKPLSVKRKR